MINPTGFLPSEKNWYPQEIPEASRYPVPISGPLSPGQEVLVGSSLLKCLSCSGDSAQLGDRFPTGTLVCTYLGRRDGMVRGSRVWRVVGLRYESVPPDCFERLGSSEGSSS